MSILINYFAIVAIIVLIVVSFFVKRTPKIGHFIFRLLLILCFCFFIQMLINFTFINICNVIIFGFIAFLEYKELNKTKLEITSNE
jgi:hypothetical protein